MLGCIVCSRTAAAAAGCECDARAAAAVAAAAAAVIARQLLWCSAAARKCLSSETKFTHILLRKCTKSKVACAATVSACVSLHLLKCLQVMHKAGITQTAMSHFLSKVIPFFNMFRPLSPSISPVIRSQLLSPEQRIQDHVHAGPSYGRHPSPRALTWSGSLPWSHAGPEPWALPGLLSQHDGPQSRSSLLCTPPARALRIRPGEHAPSAQSKDMNLTLFHLLAAAELFVVEVVMKTITKT